MHDCVFPNNNHPNMTAVPLQRKKYVHILEQTEEYCYRNKIFMHVKNKQTISRSLICS